MRKYNISAGDSLSQILCTPTQLTAGKNTLPYEVLTFRDKHFKLRIGNDTHEGLFIHDRKRQEIALNIQGYHYRLQLLPEYAVLSHEGAQADMKAAIPGRIIRINIQEGQKVEPGQVALVLEAMKMEHSLSVKSSAVVQSVLVKEGDQVQADQILIRYHKSDDI